MRSILFAIGLALVVGCSNGLPPTVKLAGTVTLDGVPLPEGTIVFYPADKEGASPTAAPIVDGKYNAPVVIKGQYRVAFRTAKVRTAPSGTVDSTYGAPTDPTAREGEEILPARYLQPSLPADATKDDLNLNFELQKSSS